MNRDNTSKMVRAKNKSERTCSKSGNCCFSVLKGAKGDNGKTPHIGPNENWWIGDRDTGVKAKCECNGGGDDDNNNTTSLCKIENETNSDTLYVSVCNENVGIENATPNGWIVHNNDDTTTTTNNTPNIKSVVNDFPYDNVTGNQLWFNAIKGALRSGHVDSNVNVWHDNNVGEYSFATGLNTMAKGRGSMIAGVNGTDGIMEANGNSSMIVCHNDSYNDDNSAGTVIADGLGAMISGLNVVIEVDPGVFTLGTMTASGIGAMISGANSGTMTASGTGAMISGYNTGTMTASDRGAMIFGYNDSDGIMTASDNGAMISGYNGGTMTASGNGAMISGYNGGTMEASGDGAMISGYNRSNGTMTASNWGAMIFGVNNGTMTASAEGAMIFGVNNGGTMTASGWSAMVFGYVLSDEESSATEDGCFAFGRDVQVAIPYSMGTGRGLRVINPTDDDDNTTQAFEEGVLVCGRFNDNSTQATSEGNDPTARLFCVGNGTTTTTRNNAFSVGVDGRGYVENSIETGGADYAEYFESLNGEAIDVGTTVVLVRGDNNKSQSKVRPANHQDSQDSIIGVVTATPSMLGNASSEYWHGKYVKDAWGRFVYENVDIEERVPKHKKRGEKSKPFEKKRKGYNKEKKKKKKKDEEEKERKHSDVEYEIIHKTERRRKLSPDFDPSKTYIPRSMRPEWIPVGLLGQIKIKHDQPTRSNWIKMRDMEHFDIGVWFVR